MAQKLIASLLIIFLAWLTGCECLTPKTQPDAAIEIKFENAATNVEVKDPELEADGQNVIWLKFSVDPVIESDADRKFMISTSAGDLIYNGEAKKAHSMSFDARGNGRVLLRAPLAPGPGLLTLITEIGAAQKTASISFIKALPDRIVLEAPQYVLKDTSSNLITARLFREKGVPSTGQFPTFQLTDEKNVLVVEKASFTNTTVSDSAGVCKSTLVLNGLKKGRYKITASLPGKSDPKWSLDIEVASKI